MSYCRFSTDDFKSDVYCYEGDGGFVIHVACNRYLWRDELPPKVELKPENVQAWIERDQVVYQMMEQLQAEGRYVKIGLPCDGESYYGLDSPGVAAEKLKELKELGYNVPDGVIECLIDEQEQHDSSSSDGGGD